MLRINWLGVAVDWEMGSAALALQHWHGKCSTGCRIAVMSYVSWNLGQAMASVEETVAFHSKWGCCKCQWQILRLTAWLTSDMEKAYRRQLNKYWQIKASFPCLWKSICLHGISIAGIPITHFMESLLQGSLSCPPWKSYSRDSSYSLHGIPTVVIPITQFMESI